MIYELSELASVKRGEILVTRQTDPAWSPAFARLGGLVLEKGAPEDFLGRLQEIRNRHARKERLIERLAKLG